MKMTGDNINTVDYWNRKWRTQNSWIKNKRRYRFLSKLFPRLVLLKKPRRRYYLDVAVLAARLTAERFCDLACGSGVTAGIYSIITSRPSWGMDFSQEGVRFAREQAGRFNAACTFVAGNLYQVPFRDSIFDTVYVGQVLEHLEDDRRALREAIRVLRPQGNLIVTVPVEGKVPAEDHIREYSKETIETLLAQAGVREITFYDFAMPSRFAIVGKVSKPAEKAPVT